MKTYSSFVALLGLLIFASRAVGGVVINEIFYHAPDDLDGLEWVELHNPDDTVADVSGWKFTSGIEFKFPDKSAIPPGGFVVVCKDKKLFAECYDTPVIGEFKKSLADGGDTIELADASGRPVDRVKYDDSDPWPVAADGGSSSLERITPGAPGDRADNWAASPLPEDMVRPAGTPGRVNASHSANFPPIISGLKLTPSHPTPAQPIQVNVHVEDSDGVATVELRYRAAKPGDPGVEQVVAMKASDGRLFSAEIPAQDAGRLIRLRVRAEDQKKSQRFFPSPNDLRPAVSLFVQASPEMPNIPLAHIINPDPREFAEMERVRKRSLLPAGAPFSSAQGQIQWVLQTGLNLSDPWFELTIRNAPDDATYRKLKAAFLTLNSKRDALVEESLASETPAELMKALPDRIKAFQDSVLAEVLAVLPAEKRGELEAKIREQFKPPPGNMATFLRRMMNPEALWFGLATRADFTPTQIEGIQTVLLTAVRDRDEKLGSPRDFGEAQEKLGVVEQAMNAALRERLTVRQLRALDHWRGAQGSPIRPRVVDPRPRPPRGQAAFVYVDAKTRQAEVFDFIHITERSAGYKVRFHKDRPLNGMTTANVIFEYNDRFMLAEPLAYELYRRVGNAACQTDFVRLAMNGQPVGYHLLIEQVNGAFLRRHKRDPGGDLYKILWYGRGVEGQHEKQNNPDHTHADLVKLVDALNSTQGGAQWQVIEKNFNVEQVMNYFAVNLVLSHWDGFFNNYFTLRDRKGNGKWEMYPWDQDKTWGFHDSSGDKVFYDMPLTFGMAGDRPPGGGEARFNPGSWWRPGGYFSKPLLANPEFRQRYLRRIRQVLEETYTETVFFPVIDGMAARLKPEISIRANAVGENPSAALARLDRNVASLKEHLTKRRQFLLDQEEIKKLKH